MIRYSDAGESGDIKLKEKQNAPVQYNACEEKRTDTDKEIQWFFGK